MSQEDNGLGRNILAPGPIVRQPAGLGGIANCLEFILGGDPRSPGARPSLPSLQIAGDNLVFTFQRTAASAYLDPKVEFTTVPSGIWTAAVHGTNATIQTTGGASSDTITVTIPRNGNSRIFARLRATE